MGTAIKTWQIVEGKKLEYISSTLQSNGRTEPYDLEPWIESNTEIIGDNILVIGKQIVTKSGKIDLLGIDNSGNAIIIELKRSSLPRDVLAQAIDYASDVAQWSSERFNEICNNYKQVTLEEAFSDKFPDIDPESININGTQRIILVGFSIDSSLERMIEWLSDNYGVSINAVLLSYIKTKNGEELLTKTSIISDEVFEERIRKNRFKIAKSDEPSNYETNDLKTHLIEYLSSSKITSIRIRTILLPALLKNDSLTRVQLLKVFTDADSSLDAKKVGYYISNISNQLDNEKNGFLRQIISYDKPNFVWEKDNFSIKSEYKDLVKEILDELSK